MNDRVISAGIDVGSSAIKAAVFESARGTGRTREGARWIGRAKDRIRRRDTHAVVELVYEQALADAGLAPSDVDYVATTGEGEGLELATGHFYGMTTHARGAVFLDPRARAAVDVGALHARAIRFDASAKVEGYRMTSQCASGSGQFLENIARYLGVTLDEVGTLSLGADDPEKVSSICAVLAETDVINMVSRGITLPNILKGIHESMAGRLAKLLRTMGVKQGVVLVTGGLAADQGLTACLGDAMRELKLGAVDVRTDPGSVYAGAIGAALWGAYRCDRLAEQAA
ncbi:MAG: benzoyl-CoA reductase subunit D [Sandaracinaceae bacterium]|nr:benzoyl-CoA reductase subunit D [Sandaracinaceae bacterium]